MFFSIIAFDNSSNIINIHCHGSTNQIPLHISVVVAIVRRRHGGGQGCGD